MHVSTCTPRFYILGTAELIVLKFVWNMICGFDKAMGASVHVRTCTLHLLFRVLAWIDSRLMVVEFLEVTFSRHGTCKLLYDTSLALARSSPTRRYIGWYHQLQTVADVCLSSYAGVPLNYISRKIALFLTRARPGVRVTFARPGRRMTAPPPPHR